MFSTSTIGSSTKRPKAKINANRVTRLIVKPKSKLTKRVRPKTTGTAIATMNASLHPIPIVRSKITIRIAIPKASINSLTFSSAVCPALRVTTTSTSSGRIVLRSSSARSMTARDTETALAPFCLEIAIVTAGLESPTARNSAPLWLPRKLPGVASCCRNSAAAPQPCRT